MRRILCYLLGHTMGVEEVWRQCDLAMVWMHCTRCGARPVGKYLWTNFFSIQVGTPTGITKPAPAQPLGEQDE